MAHNPTGAALHINLRQERRNLVIATSANPILDGHAVDVCLRGPDRGADGLPAIALL